MESTHKCIQSATSYLPEIHFLPWHHSTQCVTLCVCVCVWEDMCENKNTKCILGCFLLSERFCVYVCVFLGVFSSSEQSSGNVWVTHEEMENLASSTKAVSTIWVLPSLLAPSSTFSPSHCPHSNTEDPAQGPPHHRLTLCASAALYMWDGTDGNSVHMVQWKRWSVFLNLRV